MNCELVQSHLAALLDGELPPNLAAESDRHLANCPVCAQTYAELAGVREMASAWTVDAPDISARVMQAIVADDQAVLLDELRLLRTEMAELRAEVAALRRQLPPRAETPWTPPGRFENTKDYPPKDYPPMENDPWNLIRS